MSEKYDLWNKQMQNKNYKELKFMVRTKEYRILKVMLNKQKRLEEEIVWD